MKRPPENCPYCGQAVPPWVEKSRDKIFGYWRAALRDPPPEKAGVPSDQKGTPTKTPKCDGDPIRSPHLEQLPDSGMADFPMTEKEITNFALSVFAGVLSRYRDFYGTIVGDSQFPAATAFIKGAAAAVVAVRSRPRMEKN